MNDCFVVRLRKPAADLLEQLGELLVDLERVRAARVAQVGGAELDRLAAVRRAADLGSGRIVASEIEAPNMLANLV